MPLAAAGLMRVAFQFAGADDLRGDVVGGERRPQEMGDAAAGGKGNGKRKRGGNAIYGQSSLWGFCAGDAMPRGSP